MITTTPCSNLVKNKTYYLTFDFYGRGGTPVKFIGTEKRFNHEFVKLKAEDGRVYCSSIKSWVFNEQPTNTN